jgi:pyruvate dehydrogenase E2 component (dihydrolipoamide acetyltransferase)
VKQVNTKSLLEVAQENRSNIEKARKHVLSQDKLAGGTITLSNLGMFDINHFTALINPPESCILAIGTIDEKAVSRDGQILSTRMMTLTASFDHRVIDGAVGAMFLQEVKFLLQNPELALV